MAKKSLRPVDVLVGQNIRICRLQQGMSQTELGRRIGLTFQQIQKSEKGLNRVGAGRLTQLAEALSVPLASLFDGRPTMATRDDQPLLAGALLAEPHSLRLVEAFDRIEDGKRRLAVLQLIEAVGEAAAPRTSSGKKHSRYKSGGGAGRPVRATAVGTLRAAGAPAPVGSWRPCRCGHGTPLPDGALSISNPPPVMVGPR